MRGSPTARRRRPRRRSRRSTFFADSFGGAWTALVGDPETAAARMKEYVALGIDTLILSGYPLLEEAYRFAELVMPVIAQTRHGVSDHAKPSVAVDMGPSGETIAGEWRPAERAASQS